MKALRILAVLLLVALTSVGCGSGDKCTDADSRLRECDVQIGVDSAGDECFSDLEACVADCILAEPEGECDDIKALYDDGDYDSAFGTCSTICFREHTESE
jgi:hypothetical protein